MQTGILGLVPLRDITGVGHAAVRVRHRLTGQGADLRHPDFEDGQLDLIHFAATAGGKLYDSGFKDGFKEGLMFEAYLNDLAGWAGDLQTLIRDDILPNTSEDAGYDEIYEKTKDYLSNTDPDSSTFSYVDLISDIDGYNVAKQVRKNKSISAIMTDYYTFGFSTRYTEFSNGASKTYLRVLAKVFTVPNFAVFFRWPLLSSVDSIPKNVTNGVADAFADYIWEMAQLEKEKGRG